jgi:hypothetical protein
MAVFFEPMLTTRATVLAALFLSQPYCPPTTDVAKNSPRAHPTSIEIPLGA